ncbi:MAG TPA: alpha/beta hydrolase [Conexibacter sp.]|nr:alpha/beta hydrolase [Conexibacter sp.]
MSARSDRSARPEPQVVETRLGPVEVAVVGEGAPVLVVHGTPGGWDQAAAMARFMTDDPGAGVKAILPSRPGYLGTALGDCATIDAQADLHAALLDALGVERVGVLCWSGGGPSSYRLAVRHPDRVRAIVALDAVSKAYPRPHEDVPTRLMFTTRAGNWLLRAMSAHAPKQLIQATLEAEGSLSKEELEQRTREVFGDDDKRRFVLELDASVLRHDGRQAGYGNDIDQFEAIESLELERVEAPCLIVQGSVDTDVTPDYSDVAATTIPNAELLTLDGGTHLAFYTHPEASGAQERALELLLR